MLETGKKPYLDDSRLADLRSALGCNLADLVTLERPGAGGPRDGPARTLDVRVEHAAGSPGGGIALKEDGADAYVAGPKSRRAERAAVLLERLRKLEEETAGIRRDLAELLRKEE